LTNRTDILNKFEPVRDNLLLILHEIQNSCPEHYISEEDMIEVAGYLNVSYSSVYGVVTYYSMLRRAPGGKYIIRVCNSPVCEMTGKESVLNGLERILKIGQGETTADKLFTLETTECLGHCEESPCMIVNREFYGNLDKENLRDLIDSLKTGSK
jgi:NADH-quinone oxidoreductase subunit E